MSRTTSRLAVALAPVVLASLGALACGSPAGDPPKSDITPTPLGPDHRIKDILDPGSPNHPASNTSVRISGAAFLTIDTFDETNNGKSRGTVFLQDVGSNDPYSGVSLFSPTYQPADLKPAPGDVLDLVGTYQENSSIGSAHFTAPDVLPQIAKPTVQSRFEYKVPDPRVVDPQDLNDYTKGRQWLSMVVTVNDVTFPDDLTDDGSGRDTAHITSSTSGVTVSNELFDLAAWNKTAGAIGKGKHVKSITGVVTWFFNFHVAPRSPADIVVQ